MESLKEWLNVADGIVLVVVILGMFGGIRRGFSGELLRFITIAIAIYIGWRFSDQATAWLTERSDWPENDLKAVAFFGLIVITYVILGIIRHSFRLLLDFSFRGKLEILGGALLGLIRAMVFCAVALLGASMIPFEPIQAAVKQSRSGKLAIEYVGPLYSDWAEKNPEFRLPGMNVPDVPEQLNDVQEIVTEAVPGEVTEVIEEVPEIMDEELGPLITPDQYPPD
jgi:uncharacterized membrane protein required for colicin V production